MSQLLTQTSLYEPQYSPQPPYIKTAADVPGRGPGLYPRDEADYLRVYGSTDPLTKADRLGKKKRSRPR
jgi:hypothetical protein